MPTGTRGSAASRAARSRCTPHTGRVWEVEPMMATVHGRRGDGGFSLIELLVTIVLAGIIFLAMVPLFVSGLKTTSTNTRRVVATNVAQARIEKMRMLGANWPARATRPRRRPATAPSRRPTSTRTPATPALFGTTYTPAAGGQPYTITTSVSPDSGGSDSRLQDRHGDGHTVHRQLQDHGQHGHHEPHGHHGHFDLGQRPTGNGPYTLTVAFKNWPRSAPPRASSSSIVNTSATPTPSPRP